MRLRNIPRAEGVIRDHRFVIKRPEDQKGCWRQVFGNKQPIYIEIGMGKGRFLLNMAKEHPDINFVGIERYSSVLLRAVERLDAMEEQPDNIRFICMDAAEIEEVFGPEEVDRIYLNFSDPWPKARHAKRRLTSTAYWPRYDKILKKDGVVEFKTDNQGLFSFSLEQAEEAGWKILSSTFDLQNNEEMNKGNVMTEYEEKVSQKGNPICKLIASRE